MIESSKNNEYTLYFLDKKGEDLAKKIINREYKVLEEFKNTERNYVAKIEIDGKKYVLKSPKAETVIPQRKIQTIFKKGEGLTSFYNIETAKKEGIDYFISPICVIVKKGIFLEESFILMDYLEGDKIRTKEDIDQILDIVKEIHKKGIYHGDLNTSNFIKTEDGIKIIDSQAKREKIWNFKRAYDILTLKRDLLVLELKYDIDKNYKIEKGIGYHLANLIKNFKKLSFVEKIRGIKVKLRNRGWKI